MRAFPRFLLVSGWLLAAVGAFAGPQVPVLTLGAQAVSTGYEIDGVVEAVRPRPSWPMPKRMCRARVTCASRAL